MPRKSLWLTMFLAISGCASYEQQQAAAEAAADRYCQSIGVQYGTSDYAHCRMQMTAQRSQAQAMADAQRRAALLQMGTTLMQNSQPSPTFNCTTVQNGIFTNTSCR